MADKKQVFKELFDLNLSDKTEKKKTGSQELTYLSWAYAWAAVKERYPEAHYEIKKFDGLPYVFDEKTGYMVYTEVTIDGITHEMWLPVMDGANKAMKAEPYKYTTKYGEKTVDAATMFDINKTIMRCLVKNLAMFGLGLYIFAGEDLPIDDDKEEKPVEKKKEVKTTKVKQDSPEEAKLNDEMRSNVDPDLLPDPNRKPEDRAKRIKKEIERTGLDEAKLLDNAKVDAWENITDAKYVSLLEWLLKKPDKDKK